MQDLTTDEILSNLYYDLETGYSSVNNLYKQAKDKITSITLEDVKKWMKNQPNKQRKNYKGFNSYKAPFPRYEYQWI